MSSLKLPLRMEGTIGVRLIFDDEGNLVASANGGDTPAITQHRAEVIVAALEADAEYDVHRRTRDVWRHNMGDKTPEELIDRLDIALDLVEELENTEKETQGG